MKVLLRATLKNRKGITLLEILVAVFVLAIVALPLLSMFSNNLLLLRTAYEKTDASYDAKAMMENYYPLGYAALFQKGAEGAMQLDAPSGKHFTLQVSPSGPAVTGAACYMHLFVGTGGSGTFAGPDGKLEGAGLPAVNASSINLSALESDGTYTLTDGSGKAVSGAKPAGAKAVLIVISHDANTELHIAVSSGTAVLVYSPAGTKRSGITVTGTAAQLFLNDAPPAKMLVTAVLKTYGTASPSSQESVFQDTLTVGALP